MKAIVVYLRDDVVTEDTYEADRITVKILADGRGYVTVDNDMAIYRRVERILIKRGDRAEALTGLGDA